MDSYAAAAAKILAWDIESRKSVEIRTRHSIQNLSRDAGQPSAFDTMTEHYIESAAGRRFLEVRGLKGDELVLRSSHYGDGTKFVDINYRPEDLETQNTIFLNRRFWMEDRNDRKQVPIPLVYLYVGREPLHQALPKAEYLGQDEVIGRDRAVFLFHQVRWAVPQDQMFYLDNATSIPLKVEAFRDLEARTRETPIWTWTAETLDEVQGHSVPLKSIQVGYDQEGVQEIIWNYEIESIEFNKDHPASMFQPVFQPGVTVFDSVSNKVTVTPGERKPDVKRETSGASQPIYADPPRDWSAVASGAALVFGAAVLLAAAFQWWRRG